MLSWAAVRLDVKLEESWKGLRINVLPAEIKQLIARLDPGSFTAFVEGLLSAESARLGMPPGSLVMSDALTENDGGLDARLDEIPEFAPDGTRSALPVGSLDGFQLKATKNKQPSAFQLSKELRKPGPQRVLNSGGTYVLVSSQDLNPAQRHVLEDALLTEATAVVNDSTFAVLRSAGRRDYCPAGGPA